MNKIGIGITFFVGLIIGGLAYWFQPYNQTSVLGINMWLIMGIGALVGSLLLNIASIAKPHVIALLVSLGVVLAVLFRIIYDTIFWDPTSHNLAPFELLLASAVTIPSAFIGILFGVFLKKNLK